MTHIHIADPPAEGERRIVRLLSYNIQVATGGNRPRHYVTQSWKHLLPHAQIYENMDRIAHIVGSYDIVALQEVDAGSLRSAFVNQTQYLAEKGNFPHWYHQVNRNLGRLAKHSNGLLSHFRPNRVEELRLPGFIPGRGALCAWFGHSDNPLLLIIMHLALGRSARLRQLASVSEIVASHRHAVVMGDFNCQPDSPEIQLLLSRTELCEPGRGPNTFPSWRPQRKIDHILVTPSLEVTDIHVLNYPFSDHLPIAMDIAMPEDIHLETV